jgi:hypothetical protein
LRRTTACCPTAGSCCAWTGAASQSEFFFRFERESRGGG